AAHIDRDAGLTGYATTAHLLASRIIEIIWRICALSGAQRCWARVQPWLLHSSMLRRPVRYWLAQARLDRRFKRFFHAQSLLGRRLFDLADFLPDFRDHVRGHPSQ